MVSPALFTSTVHPTPSRQLGDPKERVCLRFGLSVLDAHSFKAPAHRLDDCAYGSEYPAWMHTRSRGEKLVELGHSNRYAETID